MSDLLAMDLVDSDDLCVSQMTLENKMFNCELKIKKLLVSTHSSVLNTTTSAAGKGMKLPKIDVPPFDGQVINWSSFWE